MALRVDDENDEDDNDEAELRQSNTCEHRHLLRASGASRFGSARLTKRHEDRLQYVPMVSCLGARINSSGRRSRFGEPQAQIA
jgi:hypothetical protein